MAGKALLAVAAFAVLAGGASAATRATTLDPAKLTLQASDFPGAHSAGSPIKGAGPLLGGYLRAIKLAKPYGASRYSTIVSFSFVATDAAAGAKFYAVLGHQLSSKSGRLSLVKEFLAGAGTKTKTSSVGMSKPRALGIHDSSMQVGFVVKTPKKKLDMSVTVVRLDRVIDLTLAAGTGRTASAADARALTQLAATHISSALAPVDTAPPTITGTAAQGQTLTATTGTWDNAPTAFTYQWQRCSSAGTCAGIGGAVAASYTVTSADAGSTLRVVVTGANRFGSLAATSAQTAAVT